MAQGGVQQESEWVPCSLPPGPACPCASLLGQLQAGLQEEWVVMGAQVLSEGTSSKATATPPLTRNRGLEAGAEVMLTFSCRFPM